MLIDVNSEEILTWEQFDREGNPNLESFKELKKRVNESLWTPDPAIVISPMPNSYNGSKLYFLYNGHTRINISKKYNLPLNGLIVEEDEEIPKDQLINQGTFGLEGILRNIICRMIQPHSTIDEFWQYTHSLTYLIEEFNKFEQNNQS